MSIREWRDLRRQDPSAYRRELTDRPARFDPVGRSRAIRLWHNEFSPEGDGPFAGVPVVAKDLFDVRGEVTGCSSRLFIERDVRGAGAAGEDAWLVDFFRRRGASLVGRSHMNEFAYGLDGFNAYSGDCPHPLDPRRIPGGSSSGSAWSVAAGVVPVALGTDTGGSIRLPAAMCGIYGFRGALREHTVRGAFPLAPSFDTTGWFTASAEDMALVLEEYLRETGGDTGSEAAPDGETAVAVLPPKVHLDDAMGEAWRRVDAILRGLGFSRVSTREGDERLGDAALDAYNVIGSRDAWEVHKEWMDPYREDYTPVVWSLIDRGRHWTAERYAAAQETLRSVRAYTEDLFSDADVIVLPATPWKTPVREDVTGEFRSQVLRLNTIGSFGGLPALSLPIRFDAITSGGIQLICRPGEERRFVSMIPRWEKAIEL